MDTLFVKPRPGRMALHEAPPHAPILLSGETVPATPYYLRQRDLHGDTVDAVPDAPAPVAAEPASGNAPHPGPLPRGEGTPAAPCRRASKPNTKQED